MPLSLAVAPWAATSQLPTEVVGSAPGVIHCWTRARLPYDFQYGGTWHTAFSGDMGCDGGWDDAFIRITAQWLYGSWVNVQTESRAGLYAGTYLDKGFTRECQAATWRTRAYGQVYHGNILNMTEYSNSVNIDCK